MELLAAGRLETPPSQSHGSFRTSDLPPAGLGQAPIPLEVEAQVFPEPLLAQERGL